MTPTIANRLVCALGCAVAAAIPLITPLTASAGDGDTGTSNILSPMVIPYEGVLMLDGQPMTGQHTLRFTLWDSPTASANNNVAYREVQAAVNFYNGRFSVALGTGTNQFRSVSTAVADGEKLYLSVSIQDQNNNFVDLSGRQVIEAVPFAAWSANSADLSVGGNATINGNVTVGGTLDVTGDATFGDATITRDADVNGSVNAARLNGPYYPAPVGWNGISANGLASGAGIVNDINLPHRALMVVGNNAANAGIRLVKVWDNLEVDRDLIVNVDGDFGRNLDIVGKTTTTNLEFKGRLTGWRRTSGSSVNDGTVALNVTASDGFCYVSSIYFDTQSGDSHPGRCRVYLDGVNWRLQLQEGGRGATRTNVDCEAMCIKFAP